MSCCSACAGEKAGSSPESVQYGQTAGGLLWRHVSVSGPTQNVSGRWTSCLHAIGVGSPLERPELRQTPCTQRRIRRHKTCLRRTRLVRKPLLHDDEDPSRRASSQIFISLPTDVKPAYSCVAGQPALADIKYSRTSIDRRVLRRWRPIAV